MSPQPLKSLQGAAQAPRKRGAPPPQAQKKKRQRRARSGSKGAPTTTNSEEYLDDYNAAWEKLRIEAIKRRAEHKERARHKETYDGLKLGSAMLAVVANVQSIEERRQAELKTLVEMHEAKRTALKAQGARIIPEPVKVTP